MVLFFMFTKEIIEIIQKYQDIVAEEISNINISIDKIKHKLKSMSGVLMDEVMSYSRKTKRTYYYIQGDISYEPNMSTLW